MPSTAGRIHYKTAPGQLSFDEEAPQGPPVSANPLGAAEPTYEVITQVYMQRLGFYRRPAENARCPAEISRRLAFFCDDSPREVMIADVVTWTRTWATIPDQHFDYTSVSLVRPGYGYTGSVSEITRAEFAATVAARITFDYYLIGAGGTYSSVAGIPVVGAAAFASPASSSPQKRGELFAGGALLVGGYSGSASDWSTPSQSTYRGAVTTDAATADSFSYAVETSTSERLIGNIFRRRSMRVKAA